MTSARLLSVHTVARVARMSGRVLGRSVAVLALLGAVASLVAVASGGQADVAVVLMAALVAWVPPLLLVSGVLFALTRWRVMTAVTAVLLLVVLAWLRPFPGGGTATTEAAGPIGGAGSRTELTVLSLNMQFGWADATQILARVHATNADLVVLTEMPPDAVARLRAAGIDTALPYSTMGTGAGAYGTGLWSTRPLVAPHPIAGTSFAAVQATIVVAGRPVVVTGVHPASPVINLATWQADYALITQAVRDRDGDRATQILAGDLNASTANGPLRRLLDTGLRDAGGAVSWSWQGQTWPNDRAFPPVIRIDHVLTTPDIDAQSLSTFTIDGSDHRGIVARLSVAAH